MQAPFLLIPPLLLRLCLLFRRRPGVFSFLCVRWVPENRNSSSSRHHRRRRPDCLLSVQKQYYCYGRLQCRAVPGRAAGRRTRRVHSLKETRERGIKILSCGIRSWFFCCFLETGWFVVHQAHLITSRPPLAYAGFFSSFRCRSKLSAAGRS